MTPDQVLALPPWTRWEEWGSLFVWDGETLREFVRDPRSGEPVVLRRRLLNVDRTTKMVTTTFGLRDLAGPGVDLNPGVKVWNAADALRTARYLERLP